MVQQPRIVCAVDGPTGSENAFSYGLAIAKSRGVQLDVVCAIPAWKQLRWHVRQTAASLDALRRWAAAENVDMAVTVQHGSATDVILRHANSPNSRVPELIVLGTRNRRGLERLRALMPLSPDLYRRVHVQVTTGLVVDEIARAAREMRADLVVIGVTKRGRLARLLASTTGLALRRLECPVLAVPQTKSTLHSHADPVVAAA